MYQKDQDQDFESLGLDLLLNISIPGVYLFLGECVRKSSVTGCEGYKRCEFKGKRLSAKWSCKKNNVLCNCKCRDSSSCLNKLLICIVHVIKKDVLR
ncbi:Hypothetical protein CINCED_3A008816 [Cinara cedri]|uniref:Uncharacterized protein n=1 Tax=Cinara cedri TaxID=506608 RepID=A0A5E4MC46_9HEMI|nr:Hypothetical protein CINCED_3A008816 [Cinara cedri]